MTNNLPLSTPLDIRLGLTKASDVAFPLRWGILSAGRISGMWVEALHACEGAAVTAVATRESVTEDSKHATRLPKSARFLVSS